MHIVHKWPFFPSKRRLASSTCTKIELVLSLPGLLNLTKPKSSGVILPEHSNSRQPLSELHCIFCSKPSPVLAKHLHFRRKKTSSCTSPTYALCTMSSELCSWQVALISFQKAACKFGLHKDRACAFSARSSEFNKTNKLRSDSA